MKAIVDKLKKLNRAAATLSGTMIFVISLFAVIEVIARTAFDYPTKWSLAFSQFILLYAIFLGSAYCFQQGGHIRVDLLVDKLPVKIRLVVNIVGLFISGIFVGVLAWMGYENMVISARFDFLTITTIQIPAAYLYAIILIGSILMLFSLLAMIYENVIRLTGKEEGDVDKC